MRKRLLPLLILLLFAACSSPEPMERVVTVIVVEESRGQEEAARATPLPPREKNDLAQLVETAPITTTQAVTTTLPVSATVRGESAEPIPTTGSLQRGYRCPPLHDMADDADE